MANKIDSLAHQLNTDISKQKRGETLVALAWEYLYTDYYKAEKTAKEAIDFNRKNNLLYLQAEALTVLGYRYMYGANMDSSFICFSMAKNIATNIGNDRQKTLAYSGLGEIYERRNEYNKAFMYFKECIKLSRQINDTTRIANAYSDLFRVTSILKLMPQRKIYFDSSLYLYRQKNDVENISMLYLMCARSSVHLERLQESFRCLRIYDSLAHSIDFIGDPGAYNLIAGSCYRRQLQVTPALKALDNAEEWFIKIHEPLSIGEVHLERSYAFTIGKQLNKAYYFANSSLEWFKKSGNKKNILLALQQLVALDSIAGNKDSSYLRYSMYNSIANKVFNEAIIFEDKELSTLLASEKKEEENLRLGMLEKEAKKRLALIVFSLFVFMAASGIIFYQYLKIKTALRRERIFLTNEKNTNLELERLNELKDKMLSIMSHELRSPLTSLLGLLSLSKVNAATKEDYEKYLPMLEAEAQNSIFLLDNLLFWTRGQMQGLQVCCVSTSLINPLQECIKLNKLIIERKNLQIINKVSAELIVFADPNILKLVIRNIFNNAIKFTPKGKCIYLDAMVIESNIHLSITDEGVGMQQSMIDDIIKGQSVGSVRGTEQEKGTGIGLQFSIELLKKMGCNFIINSKPNIGTVFTVILPKAYS